VGNQEFPYRAGLFAAQEELLALAALKIDDVPNGCLDASDSPA